MLIKFSSLNDEKTFYKKYKEHQWKTPPIDLDLTDLLSISMISSESLDKKLLSLKSKLVSSNLKTEPIYSVNSNIKAFYQVIQMKLV